MHTPATIFLLTVCLFESSSAAGLRGITTRRLQNDPAFIHKGCSEKKGLRPEYSEHGMFGRGWYCSDGKMCGDDQNFEHTCDHAQIHRGCRHLVGLKPKYDHSTHTWYCSDRHHGHHQQHGFVEIDSYAQQCVRDRHPLWHRHGHRHGFTAGAAASSGGGGRRYVCYQSCCVEHSSVVAFDSGFVESEFDVSCESEWSTCGAHHHHH